jgi:glutaminase
VIRVIYDGSQVHSKKLRRNNEMQFLESNGQLIRVYQLQGDLMFGSTESVVKNVIDALPDGDYFILDLKHVFEIDRSACQLIQKLKDLIYNQGKTLLFTHTSDKYGFTRYMKLHTRNDGDQYMFAFSDTDHALEWCEDKLLTQDRAEQLLARVELGDQDLCQGLTADDIIKLKAIVKLVSYEAYKTVFRCGDAADSMFLIIEGEVEVLLPTEAGIRKRLAMLSPGMSFGEMALLNHRTRSADVRTTCNSQFAQIVFDEIPEDIRLNLITNFAEQLARKLGRETRELQHLD